MDQFISFIEQWVDVKQLTTQVIEFAPKLIAALLVLLAAWIIFRVVRKIFRAALKRVDFQPPLIDLLVDKILRYTVYIIAIIMSLDQLGVDVTTALAGVGVMGIAVGFAAQDAVSNVIAGILIFWDKPFQVGDWIETEEEYGQVTDITLRTTRIRTPRNTYVVIPNKRIIDEVLENFTKHGELRVDVPIGIAYSESIDEAREVLLKAVSAMDVILSDPEPGVVVDELGGSSVNLKIRAWIDSADDARSTYFKISETGKVALDDAGIEIPFPHLQLHVDKVDEAIWQQVKQQQS
ncbi:MAG: mechanosensitive ion channel family protein [Pseudomonadales bacterium]